MVYLMNTSIIPADFEGLVRVETIDLETAKEILEDEKWVSAIGHKATADLLSHLLGMEIPFNRITVSVKSGDVFICFQPQQRMEEGRIYSYEEMKRIPLVIKKLTFLR